MSNQEEESSIRMENLGWSKVKIDSAAQESWEFGGFMGLEVLSASSYTIEKDASTGASVIKKKKKKKEKDEKERSKKNKKKKNKKHVEQEKKKGIATKAVKEAKVNISTPWRSTRLHQNLLVNAARQGFETPTPIQRAVCVKDVLSGSRDVVGTAETGSGKTLAFGLPVLHRLLVRKKNKRQSQEKRLQCLIVTPTRELALQIEKHLKEACLGSKIQIVSVVGGMAEQKQKRLLSRKPEIVVGTPGRLWAMIEDLETASYFRNLHELKFLVLDEVDRMFDRNAFPELKKILKRITEPRVVEDMTIDDEEEDGAEEEPKKKLMKSSNSYRQTFVMSATTAIPDRKNKKRKISADEKEYLNWIRKTLKLRKRPLVANVTKTKSILTIDASSSRKLPPGLDLRQIHCPSEDKDAHLYLFLFECLRNMTSLGESECRILVFANSIAHIKRLSLLLSLLQLPIHSLHAKMQQRQRLKNLDRFRNESCTILIATDVAARGLDIENIHYVVHYHLPNTVDTFVHRSGRTARARRVGMALSLVSPKEQKMYTRICTFLLCVCVCVLLGFLLYSLTHSLTHSFIHSLN